MKPLKEHILEGLLDIEDNINIDASVITEDAIKDFLEKNYNIDIYIIKYVKNKFIVDVKGNADVKNENITSLTNNLFKFNEVTKDFYCANCNNLTSLEGAPNKCFNFYCHHCDSLKSLKGAPKEVGGNFNCSYCDSLTSLEYSPKVISVRFSCYNCNNLKSLKGAPQECYSFDCSNCDSLNSLEGSPQKCHSFDCNSCKSLKSLKGLPKKIDGGFDCHNCESLITLEGSPEKVGGNFYCDEKFKKEVKNYIDAQKIIYK